MVKTPKKPSANAPANPYANIKFSYNGSPLNKKKSNINTNAIWSIQTGVDCVVISFSVRGDGKCSYVWPFKQHFIDHGESQGLTQKWGTSGFMIRYVCVSLVCFTICRLCNRSHLLTIVDANYSDSHLYLQETLQQE